MCLIHSCQSFEHAASGKLGSARSVDATLKREKREKRPWSDRTREEGTTASPSPAFPPSLPFSAADTAAGRNVTDDGDDDNTTSLAHIHIPDEAVAETLRRKQLGPSLTKE